MSIAKTIDVLNQRDLSSFVPWFIACRGKSLGSRHYRIHCGYFHFEFAQILLLKWPKIFVLASGNEEELDKVGIVINERRFVTKNKITTQASVIDKICEQLREMGIIKGWREERYPISTPHYYDLPFTLERAAVPYFGICAQGVHLNAFVKNGEGLKMWVAKRSADRPSFAGKLDQIAAGGQPANLDIFDNMHKECMEEASIPSNLRLKMSYAGTVSYALTVGQTFKPDTIHCFDLELPQSFVPRNKDGEVEEFYLWDITEILEHLNQPLSFKPNCALVIVDFMIRHQILGQKHQDFHVLCDRLNVDLHQFYLREPS